MQLPTRPSGPVKGQRNSSCTESSSTSSAPASGTQGQDAQHRIIQIAKAVGAIRQTVMGAPAGNVDRAGIRLRQKGRRQHHTPCPGGRAAVYLGEDRVGQRADL